jgi:Lrp/AsnC family transcriptional regulator, regulator for asnA, asnC and gidA
MVVRISPSMHNVAMEFDSEGRLLLDDLDHAIIHAYWLDPKAGNAAVARSVGTSEATVRRRVQALVDADVLQFSVVLGRPTSSGYLEFLMGVCADGHRVEQIADAIAELPRVRYLGTALGSFDIILAASVHEMDEWKQLRATIAAIDGVNRTETFLITDVRKRALDRLTPDELFGARNDIDDRATSDDAEPAVALT